ncbi:thiamine pyrophosphate-binding protein [Sphaerisporangium perillae]|uniref:thiamine pyrophosphate-binding protein n=1 Tax=Sphaerisporangium perillae TaxID=2935860 RepID=UPI002010332C|nr:thiamine pyrophosphate-binding protein [Sphaerisporangium perillae]
MIVAHAVGEVLAGLGVSTAFGVVGSGNFHVTNALVKHGVRFVAARHEGGAATMADAYARMSGTVGVLSVHQGPGLTNAMTGITEAAKSRTPLLVLAAEVLEPRSNFHIDQSALAEAVGAVPERVESAVTAVADTVRAWRLAAEGRRTVLLNLPLGVQAEHVEDDLTVPYLSPGEPALEPSAEAAAELAGVLAGARRPVFVAGRGARHARRELETLADLTGALLATSAVARGLFTGSPWNLDVSGGFASPLTAELIREADVIVGWGCSLNMWTMRHGTLIGPSTTVVQVDVEAGSLGAHRPVDLGVLGDVAATARTVADLLAGSGADRSGGGENGAGGGAVRTPALAERIAREVAWRDVPYTDGSGGGRIDPRTLSIGLDDLLPVERVVAVDSGNFMGYPSMFLSVPDENGLCFTQGFQSIGLGLATAIGAALARPDRLPVAALGDGGTLMGIAELETVVRLGLPMVIVVYDDEAYGAEVYHFGPDGHALDQVRFPPRDIAAIGRGFGCAAVTVRECSDLAEVSRWLDGPRDRPLLVHAKVTADRGSWWLEEAFRGH